MKKIFLCLFSILIILLNIYLIFYWQPQGNTGIKEENIKATVSYIKTFYKVDKEKAMEQLSYDDRKDFERILKKLSTLDMGRIKEYYQDSDEEEGIVNIFKILKKRLTSEDYRRIEEISSSLLEIDEINKKIKNN